MPQAQWQIVPFGWTVHADGTVRAETPQGALLLKDSFSQAGELSATVVVHRAVTNPTYWKTVGITLWQDDRHHWRLNLVEAPENLQYRHTAELHEMYGGTWLAGNEPATRLTIKESFSLPGWSWEYGKPYRLRLIVERRNRSAERCTTRRVRSAGLMSGRWITRRRCVRAIWG
jgi:hypothetical protein